MKNERESVEIVLDNCMLQLSEMSIKINVMTTMVLSVYRETLPAENFLKIAKTFFYELEKQADDIFGELDKSGLLHDPAIALRYRLHFELSIASQKQQFGLLS